MKKKEPVSWIPRKNPNDKKKHTLTSFLVLRDAASWLHVQGRHKQKYKITKQISKRHYAMSGNTSFSKAKILYCLKLCYLTYSSKTCLRYFTSNFKLDNSKVVTISNKGGASVLYSNQCPSRIPPAVPPQLIAILQVSLLCPTAICRSFSSGKLGILLYTILLSWFMHRLLRLVIIVGNLHFHSSGKYVLSLTFYTCIQKVNL